jgi:hypothetical protein
MLRFLGRLQAASLVMTAVAGAAIGFVVMERNSAFACFFSPLSYRVGRACKATVKRRADERPWPQRRPVAAWRGGTSGKSCWDGTPGTPIQVQQGGGGGGEGGGTSRRKVNGELEEVTPVPTIPVDEQMASQSSVAPCGRRALRLAAASVATRHLFDVGYDYLSAEAQLDSQALVYAEGHCGCDNKRKPKQLHTCHKT